MDGCQMELIPIDSAAQLPLIRFRKIRLSFEGLLFYRDKEVVMVTLDKPYNHPFTFKGKSTDTKPIAKWGDLAIENGDYFLEMDTGNVFFYDKGAESGDPWVEPS